MYVKLAFPFKHSSETVSNKIKHKTFSTVIKEDIESQIKQNHECKTEEKIEQY